MWKQPWGYAEGAVICSGLFITGTALQFTTGPVNANLFQPVGGIKLVHI